MEKMEAGARLDLSFRLNNLVKAVLDGNKDRSQRALDAALDARAWLDKVAQCDLRLEELIYDNHQPCPKCLTGHMIEIDEGLFGCDQNTACGHMERRWH